MLYWSEAYFRPTIMFDTHRNSDVSVKLRLVIRDIGRGRRRVFRMAALEDANHFTPELRPVIDDMLKMCDVSVAYDYAIDVADLALHEA